MCHFIATLLQLSNIRVNWQLLPIRRSAPLLERPESLILCLLLRLACIVDFVVQVYSFRIHIYRLCFIETRTVWESLYVHFFLQSLVYIIEDCIDLFSTSFLKPKLLKFAQHTLPRGCLICPQTMHEVLIQNCPSTMNHS